MNNYYPVCHHTILCHECTCPNRFLKGYDLWRWMMFHSTMGKKNTRVFFDGKIFLIYYIKVSIFCLARLLWINISQFLGSLYLYITITSAMEFIQIMNRIWTFQKYCFPRLLLHKYIHSIWWSFEFPPLCSTNSGSRVGKNQSRKAGRNWGEKINMSCEL